MTEENSASTKPPSMTPIMLAVLGIVAGLAFLLYNQMQKSTEFISAKFQAYQFMTDLQFYLMDDSTCTEMLGGNQVVEGGDAALKFQSGETLVAGSTKDLVTINILKFSDIIGGRENFYSAELSYSLSIPDTPHLNRDFFNERRLKFYYKSVDGKTLDSCGVKDMLSAE
ncbi:MAG: hypothetical protein CL677_06450 [Bdellovibrionaceae bacterium]|nr:hypothetical protein [Pseudobdellovibrionaceae bacterium]|tara:strand:+ start:19911 stop:20417 length:507 start_codon:yes stop_codon:yes gene_type:complete